MLAGVSPPAKKPRGESRHRELLLDALASLLVQLHIGGVYWGDCSLFNTFPPSPRAGAAAPRLAHVCSQASSGLLSRYFNTARERQRLFEAMRSRRPLFSAAPSRSTRVSGERAVFLGRDAELAVLEAETAEPRIVYVHGIAGVGKSSLLRRLIERCHERSVGAMLVDMRDLDPTPEALIAALARGLRGDRPPPRVTEPDERSLLRARWPRIVVIDTYQATELADRWLVDTLAPALSPLTRVVIAGRERAFGDLGRVRGLAAHLDRAAAARARARGGAAAARSARRAAAATRRGDRADAWAPARARAGRRSDRA